MLRHVVQATRRRGEGEKLTDADALCVTEGVPLQLLVAEAVTLRVATAVAEGAGLPAREKLTASICGPQAVQPTPASVN
jgi:hypothetical protein